MASDLEARIRRLELLVALLLRQLAQTSDRAGRALQVGGQIRGSSGS